MYNKNIELFFEFNEKKIIINAFDKNFIDLSISHDVHYFSSKYEFFYMEVCPEWGGHSP